MQLTFQRLVPLLLLPMMMLLSASCSFGQGLEVGGGWAHETGDFGLDGFDVGGGALLFGPRVSIAFNYDDTYDTSTVGTFELTTAGQISVKSHMQNILVGPRIFFPAKKITKYRLTPFAEAQFGYSHLSTDVMQVSTGQQSVSGDCFSWLLGGGANYDLTHSWALRGNLDFLRSHFADSGQSHLRLVLGVVYTFGKH